MAFCLDLTSIKQTTSQPTDILSQYIVMAQDPKFPEHLFQCVTFKSFIN